MHSRGLRHQRGNGSRRAMAWDAGPEQVPVSLSAAGATLWATGAQALSDDLTIVRTRGQLTLNLTSIATIGDGYAKVGLGICIVPENAFNAGVGSVPTPLTDIGWDGWMWHMLLGQFRGFSTTELGTGPMEAVRVDIDSKAMRKTHASDFVMGAVELGTETGTAVLGFVATTRMLFKLP